MCWQLPQVSGMRFTFDPNQPANGGRVTSIDIDEDGSWVPLDLNKTYGMVSNNFIRGGGDGYKVFRSASDIYDFGPDLAEVVADYIGANPGYSGYTDGRIQQNQLKLIMLRRKGQLKLALFQEVCSAMNVSALENINSFRSGESLSRNVACKESLGLD